MGDPELSGGLPDDEEIAAFKDLSEAMHRFLNMCRKNGRVVDKHLFLDDLEAVYYEWREECFKQEESSG